MADIKKSKETKTVQQGLDSDSQHGAVMPPIYLSSNYTFAGIGEPRKYDYARSGNPTRAHLADALSELEGGAGGVVTASGMGALTTILHLLDAGDTIIAPHDCYGGTFRLLNSYHQQGRLVVKFVNQGDDSALTTALDAGAKMILIETPSNPLLRLVDIAKISNLAKAKGTLVACDNTFLSPALQNPLELGADLVIHSTTKYINGHSDVVGGAVIAKTDELAEKVQWWANCIGITGASFDSFLTMRGLRTLFPRIRQQCDSAQEIAEFLAQHPAVRAVYYPGLSSHPGYEIAQKQQKHAGAMLSFELDGTLATVTEFIEQLQCFALAESLGGVESLIAHPATMTHAAMTPEAREIAGISDQLIRLSIGIEHKDDLKADLAEGLNFIAAKAQSAAAE